MPKVRFRTAQGAGAYTDVGSKGDPGDAAPNWVGARGPAGSPAGITFRRGAVSVTPVANTATIAPATDFGYTFEGAPMTFVSARSSVPATVIAVGVVPGTFHSSLQIVIFRTNTTATTVHWFAVGVGAPSNQG